MLISATEFNSETVKKFKNPMNFDELANIEFKITGIRKLQTAFLTTERRNHASKHR
jgi:hypothetical protein